MAPNPSRPGRLLGQPFRASDAIRDGLLSKAQLQGAGWRRLLRDVYVSAHANDDHLLRVKGAALLLPAGAVISGRSAALLWGATMGDIDTPVEVRAPTRFGPVAGLAIVTGRLHPGDVTSRWRIPV